MSIIIVSLFLLTAINIHCSSHNHKDLNNNDTNTRRDKEQKRRSLRLKKIRKSYQFKGKKTHSRISSKEKVLTLTNFIEAISDAINDDNASYQNNIFSLHNRFQREKWTELNNQIRDNHPIKNIILNNIQDYLKIKNEGIISFKQSSLTNMHYKLFVNGRIKISTANKSSLIFKINKSNNNIYISKLLSHKKGDGASLLYYIIFFSLFLRQKDHPIETISLLNKAMINYQPAPTYYMKYGFCPHAKTPREYLNLKTILFIKKNKKIKTDINTYLNHCLSRKENAFFSSLKTALLKKKKLKNKYNVG